MDDEPDDRVVCYAPDTPHPSLSRDQFDVDGFLMGDWYVGYSTLPLWKKKKDVRMFFSPSFPNSTKMVMIQFNATVEYRAGTASSSSPVTRVEGVDTLRISSGTAPPGSPHSTATRYSWRGRGLAFLAPSKWQIIGYGHHEGGWFVAWSDKTIITPTAIDVLCHSPHGLSESLFERIVDALRDAGDPLKKLADRLFKVRHGDAS